MSADADLEILNRIILKKRLHRWNNFFEDIEQKYAESTDVDCTDADSSTMPLQKDPDFLEVDDAFKNLTNALCEQYGVGKDFNDLSISGDESKNDEFRHAQRDKISSSGKLKPFSKDQSELESVEESEIDIWPGSEKRSVNEEIFCSKLSCGSDANVPTFVQRHKISTNKSPKKISQDCTGTEKTLIESDATRCQSDATHCQSVCVEDIILAYEQYQLWKRYKRRKRMGQVVSTSDEKLSEVPKPIIPYRRFSLKCLPGKKKKV